jgi:hypothetical protein
MPNNDKNENMPYAGVSPMQMAAAALHETYEELKRAGFTRREALYLVSQILITGVGAGDE